MWKLGFSTSTADCLPVADCLFTFNRRFLCEYGSNDASIVRLYVYSYVVNTTLGPFSLHPRDISAPKTRYSNNCDEGWLGDRL